MGARSSRVARRRDEYDVARCHALLWLVDAEAPTARGLPLLAAVLYLLPAWCGVGVVAGGAVALYLVTVALLATGRGESPAVERLVEELARTDAGARVERCRRREAPALTSAPSSPAPRRL